MLFRMNAYFLLASAVILIVVCSHAMAATPFIVAPAYKVDDGPNAAAVGDINGDGKLDIVTLNTVSSDLNTILGRGNGTFGAPVRSVGVSAGGSAIVLGDFNNDGHLDAAVPGTFPNRLAIFLGKGTGAFINGPTISIPGEGTGLAVADVNGDGNLDIVTANGSSQNVSVLLGNGDGTFQSPVNYGAGPSPNSVVIADFNRDGKLDLAVANSSSPSSPLSLLRGNGDGTFQAFVSIGQGKYTELAAGDLNGDGNLDLVTVGNKSTSTVFLGNGDGTFHAGVAYFSGSSSTSVTLGDVDGDGKPDIITGRQSGVSILIGNGDGTFKTEIEYASGGFALGIATGDFNADGRLDIATPNSTTGNVSVLLNSGGGRFVAARQYEVNDTVAFSGEAAIAANFNPDGNKDIAVLTNNDLPGVNVFLGNGDGTFGAPVYTALGPFPGAMAAGDFDKDHNIDLAVVNSPGVVILLGNGDGTFRTGASYSVSIPNSVTVADVDHDGKLDLLVALFSAGRPFDTMLVFLGNGDGTFRQGNMYQGALEASTVTVGDINGDGKLDAVVGCSDVNGALNKDVFIFLGNGDGTFQPPTSLKVQGSTSGIALADFNKDGKLDMVVGGYEQTAILLGNGDGTFQAEHDIGLGGGIPKVADFNGDGKLDVAVVDFQTNDEIFLGNGDGTFKPGLVLTAAGGTLTDIADFNHDGATDLLQTSFLGNNVTVLLNAR